MACEIIPIPGGGKAIVCSGRARTKQCHCGNPATLACDWKVPARKSGTCDAAICARCTTAPAPDKDLCPAHAVAFESWQANRRVAS